MWIQLFRAASDRDFYGGCIPSALSQIRDADQLHCPGHSRERRGLALAKPLSVCTRLCNRLEHRCVRIPTTERYHATGLEHSVGSGCGAHCCLPYWPLSFAALVYIRHHVDRLWARYCPKV